ncbi:hypothetical protein A8C56_04205 [Niabella ginsenosidivorans]|uniref:Uncharacterized protein n=1 Tax=Niabella ginsenosidivorans TaxID=1176587 RepID=A0A1A9HY22_9BACT|nr:hypothetical protein [Niabella ginsenosidivorans]ANH80287.1 hypothetical protein A8C56_04205 [Niabella ginsenosidivorans]
MNLISVSELINTLSAAEKRQFKLMAQKQQKEKVYLYLFDLVAASGNTAIVKAAFKKAYPSSSLDISARYLHKLLCDMLVRNQLKNDASLHLIQGLMKAKLLRQRNLTNQAIKQTRQLLSGYGTIDDLLLKYLLKREELNYLSEVQFKNISEKQLIAEQQIARDLLKNIRNLQEHYALYELLKYRLIRSAPRGKPGHPGCFNDLLLEELAIINSRAKQNPESQKLHLLFQSFYFTYTGNYPAALKTFYLLNSLFEKNKALLQHPPLDYFDTLDGLLENLKAVHQYDHMPYFINKLSLLENKKYPAYFNYLIKKTVLLFELEILIIKGEWLKAYGSIQATPVWVRNEFPSVQPQKQLLLLFYYSLICYKNQQPGKAKKILTPVITSRQDHNIFYNVCRCFNIVLHYESNDMEYLDYEIRSYKRFTAARQSPIPNIEKLLFKTIALRPWLQTAFRNRQQLKKLTAIITTLQQNPVENSLLKYFNFMEWAIAKFEQ